MHAACFGPQVRLFVEIFTSNFNRRLFGLLSADTKEGVAAAREEFAQALKVGLQRESRGE